MIDRLVRLQWVVLLALALLGLRLTYLQVIRGGHYRALAEQNRLRVIPEAAPRGLIVDRRGQALASNQTVFRVAVVPQEVENLEAVLAQVAQTAQRSPQALKREYERQRSRPFLPATIIPRVTKETAIQLEERRWQLSGVVVTAEAARRYPYGPVAAHLLGYLSEPTAEELPLLKRYGVRPKERVGRTGLEQLLDHALRGRPGGEVVEVDHQGKQVRIVGHRPSAIGADVALTIDAQLQSLVETLFAGQPGAAVVLQPDTGEVLVMASVPSFLPESFALSDNEAIERFFNDTGRPMVNRAADAEFQPGSILKLLTAVAALESRSATPQTVVQCPGGLTIGDRTIHCWNRDGHGPMSLREAIMQSCNVYFMQVGRRSGIGRLRSVWEQAGLGRRAGWPLEEDKGHVPQRRLTEGEVALVSIGQGEISVTPLQAAVMASAFANRGWIIDPVLVQTVAGRPLARRSGRRRLGWSPQTIEAIRLGMEAAVADPAGTAQRAASPRIRIAGKTGTAQTHVPGRTHGWFVGFCPVDRPRAAMAIVAELGGSGGDLPTHIAHSVCEYIAAVESL
ncbi:MAG: penicillin-binding protein 2 [Candidatus Omnitrophica bacterium CG11_big_fil_rev_8_21_14_0_20_63_9]|nr:MAG: penicillin-binding protein 2 [Candidatus Omnitrophica bacterium CG11_big_fil_rev_8_21_14_0_20_63_9]